MKKLYFAIMILSVSITFCFSETKDNDILGKWYFIPNIDEYNSVLAHDVKQFIEIQKIDNTFKIKFTLGINYDLFESKNVSLVKKNNEYKFNGQYVVKDQVIEKTIIFTINYSEDNNYILTFDEPNSVDINGIYIKKNSIIDHYIDITKSPNLEMYGYTNSDSVRLRDYFGTNGTIITKLSKNTKLIILNRSEKEEMIDGYQDYWLKIKILNNNQVGWIYGGYIDLDQDFFR